MKNKIIVLLIILVIVLGGILIFSLRKQPLVSVSSEGHVESACSRGKDESDRSVGVSHAQR